MPWNRPSYLRQCSSSVEKDANFPKTTQNVQGGRGLTVPWGADKQWGHLHVYTHCTRFLLSEWGSVLPAFHCCFELYDSRRPVGRFPSVQESSQINHCTKTLFIPR